MKKIFLLTFVLALLFVPVAHAALVMDWYFINDGVTVAPDEPVQQWARIVNADFNSGAFSSGQIGDVELDDVVGYTALLGTEGTHSFGGPWAIAEGQSWDFVLATYYPMGMAPSGTYTADPQTLHFGTNCYPAIPGTQAPDKTRNYISHSFTWTVEDASTAIPEPGSFLLLASGLLGLPFVGRKK